MGMLLSEWLSQKDVTRTEFARRIGVTPSHVTGLCEGASWPSRKIVLRIERETGGEVTANDFRHLGADPLEQAAN